MYRIMIMAAEKDNNASLYKYLLNTDGSIYEANDLYGEDNILIQSADEVIDEKVEKMLNEEGYAKKDFVVIKEINFDILASIIN